MKIYKIDKYTLEQQTDGCICVYDNEGTGYNFIGRRNIEKVKELLRFHDAVNEETNIEDIRDLAETCGQVRQAIVYALVGIPKIFKEW